MRLLNVRGEQVHLIVGAGIYDLLKKAIDRHIDELDVKVLSVREITDAHFDFSYQTLPAWLINALIISHFHY